jgi:nicotinamide-nucleotide amidase
VIKSAFAALFLYIDLMNDNSLPQQIKQLLEDRGNETVSTAESITTGHLQTKLASVSDASKVFKGGITAYQESVKVDHLDVNQALASEHNCVHEKVAEQMAQGALSMFKSDYAISTCGYAEPYPEQGITKPFAYIAIVSKKEGLLVAEKVNLSGTRVDAQTQAAQIALEKFVELLQS